MTRSTPSVHENRLYFDPADQEKALEVDSAAWFAWLQQETSVLFSFHAPDGLTYTARKEGAGNRRGGRYWKAYRKQQGRLYRAYMGKTEDLNSSRLHEIALILTEHMRKEQMNSELTKEAGQSVKRPTPALTPLLASRLRPPRLSSLLIERARLLTLLESGEGHRLTLVQAPAGFGKTTLVAQWLARRQVAEVAWISLDSGDNDPLRFWSSLIAAWQARDARIGQAALAALTQSGHFSGGQASLDDVITLLLNDLGTFLQAGVLILEDYHLIEHTRIHESLAFFIEHLPASLRVVLLTRSTPPLPLVRWRARGDVLDIQQGQLRFSSEETASFLHQITEQRISDEAVRALHRQVEGWAAGLRLLSLSFQGQETAQAIEAYLAQASAASPSARSYRPAEEYFLSEVLAAQPEPLQLFLLQTSLLSRLSASLCDAVTGRQDSASCLELAVRSGFFLEALDYTGEWYRYHALFAEAMRGEARRRLGERSLHNLSALASRWYEEHAMPLEAIEAALTAREFARAGQLIESFNERTYFTEYHTMRRWLEQLPERNLRARPMLCFLLAQARLFCEDSASPVWRLEPVEDLLRLAEEGWRAEDKTELIGVLYAFRTTFTIVHGLVEPAVVYARQALHYLPPFDPVQARQQPTEWIEWRCGCLIALSQEALQSGAFCEVRQYLQTAYALSLHNTDPIFTLMLGQMLGDAYVELGELHQASSYYQQTLKQSPWPGGRGADIMHTNTIAGLSSIHYERNELPKAEQLVQEVAHYSYSGDFSFGEENAHMKVDLLRFQLLRLRGQADEARAPLSALLVRLQSIPHSTPLLAEALLWQARWHCQNGEIDSAEHIYGRLTDLAQELLPLQAQTLQVLQARLHLARGEAGKALSLLERLVTPARQKGMVRRAFEMQLLGALALAALKQTDEAHQQLGALLAQTRNEGLLRLFLDEGEWVGALLRAWLPTCADKSLRAYGQSIIQAFATPFSAQDKRAPSPLLEPLSAQEQRVLALLVAGRNNQEIAAELVISINTVKGHVKNLYRKLNVNSRVQAGEMARQFHLL